MNMKKVIKFAFVVAVAMVAGYNVYKSHTVMTDMSEMALANVEALAQTETLDTGTLYGNASGTRYCCCPGSTRTCAASRCSNC